MMNAMGLFFLVIIAIIVLAAVLVWLTVQNGSGRKGSGGCNNQFSLLTADAVATGAITLSATATGPEGDTDAATTGFITILTTDICTARCHNRLYADVSLQTLITALSDLPTGIAGAGATTLGLASIEVQVLVDGVAAQPGIVTFDGLLRIIAAPLDPLVESLDLLTLTDASSFNFIYAGITHGTHTVEVQARLTVVATETAAILESVTALVGNRSVVVTQGNAFVPIVSSPSSPAPCCSSRF